MSSVFASVSVPLSVRKGPRSHARALFFGREDRMTSTGVVITMRTLLSPDYTDSSTKKSNNVEKIQKGVARKICKKPQ